MLKKPSLKNLILTGFITAETAVYIAFNVVAAAGLPDPIYLKYSGVLLCLAVSVALFFVTGKSADGLILSTALLFTAISDLFILVLGDYYEIGLVTFIIAQSVYFYRLYAGRIKKIYISLGVRLTVAAAAIIVFAAIGMLDLLVAECAIYITMLIANLVDALIICKNGCKNLLFAVGLALFLCCDICVGLNNFGEVLGVELPKWVINFVSYAMWAFYLPSQVLITCSVNRGGLNAPLKVVKEVEQKGEEDGER